MAQYTQAQLQQLWIDAGGDPTKASQAAAIALAESGGNSNSVNSSNSNGTVDRGLWQINSVHGPLSTFDPMANARAAVQISNNGQNWRPWCVAWSNGDCSGTFLGPSSPVWRVLNPLGSALFNGGTQAVADTANTAIDNFLGKLTAPAFNTAKWVAAILAGMFGITAGMIIILWASKAPQKIVGTATGLLLGGAETKQAVNVLKPKKTGQVVAVSDSSTTYTATGSTSAPAPAKPAPLFPVGREHRRNLAATEDELRTSLIRPPRHRRRKVVAKVGEPRHLAEGED